MIKPWNSFLNRLRKLGKKINERTVSYYNRLSSPILLFLLSVTLIVNVAYSQWISPVYYRLVDGDTKAAATYLLSIRREPQFDSEMARLEKQYGQPLRDEVFKNEIARQSEIGQLTKLLEKNNRSRDVLYDLSLLYKANGQTGESEYYLGKAREIDPGVGR